LDELVAYEQPTKYLVSSTDYNGNYPTPVLTAGQTFHLGRTNEKHGIYPASKDSAVIIFDDFTTAFKWVDFPFKAKSSAMKMLTSKSPSVADLKYIYYAMSTIQYMPSDHARQWIGTYSKFLIPIPPKEVQAELVRILDTFIQLEAALEAELEARKRQLKYMRSLALSSCFSDRGSKTTLADVTQKVSNVTWKNKDDLELEYIDLSSVDRNTSRISKTQKVTNSTAPSRAQQQIQLGDVLFGSTRPLLGKIASVPSQLDGQVCSTGFTVLRTNPALLDSRFLIHLLNTDLFFEYIEQNQEGASYPSISDAKVKNFTFTLPSLAEQARIAEMLDPLEMLVNDISIGIPSEIGYRRKQYEYYRDHLLTFKEA
jgi:type I restriction enzyme S subunit